MSETEHGPDPQRHGPGTYDLTEKLKFAERPDRILSPDSTEYQHLLRSLAWSVSWVLSFPSKQTNKRTGLANPKTSLMLPRTVKTFVLYRRLMLDLVLAPKPAFEHVVIELPCLMGFRPLEVCTWRAEWIDFQHGDTLVLDAKKHRLFSVPLNGMVAKHVEILLNGRTEGYVLQSRSSAWKDHSRPLSTVAIWYLWKKHALQSGLPDPNEFSPVVGRRFFACEWHYGQGLSLVTLQKILRHSDFETTLRYVRSLVFYEDVKRDYDRFQLGLMHQVAMTRR